MTPQDLLITAAKLVEERGETRDEGERRTMEEIVALFNVASGRFMLERMLTEDEGWLFMQCVKLVRIRRHGGSDLDSFLDLAAYTALRAEAAEKRERERA